MKRKALKAAFIHTVPVMMGYLFLGMAFGILLSTKGYGVIWAFIMSLFIYAGSGQFVAITLLTSPFDIIGAVFITLMVNLRHLFYGLSLLEPFKRAGKKKYYMMFTLTDETYSLLCSTKPPKGVDEGLFYFFIGFLDHCYWIGSCVLGNLLRTAIPFNSKGIDFVMTALFLVIFIDQWKDSKTHIPQFIGVGASLLCLVIFGASRFLLPAMVLILLLSATCRKRLEAKFQ